MPPEPSSTSALSIWLPYRKIGREPRPRLFYFPYAGGSAAAFRSWEVSLDERVEVCAVQLPGRERRLREPPYLRFPPLIDALFAALGPLLEPPFVFFGHSLGARVAYELARRLRSQGCAGPARLVVSGCRAPHLPDRSPPVHALPDDQFIQRLRTLGGTPEEVLLHPELMELMMPLMRADFELSETYAWEEGPPLDLPLTAFGGTRDPLVAGWEVEAWKEATTGTFRQQMFDGDHFFLDQQRDQVLRLIGGELAKAM